MMNRKILLIAPTSGNGGIQSWARKMLSDFPNNEFGLIHVNASIHRSEAKKENSFYRVIDGTLDLVSVIRRVQKALKANPTIQIAHLSTSGSLGTLRDYLLIKLCHKYKAKVILHCHYGCISTDLNGTGFWGRLLRKTLHSTDSIWVLDSRSFITLNTDSSFKGRVFITPNPIDVKKPVDDKPKSYISMAFVGNLIPTKGLYELVEAAVITNTHLDIIGPGKGDVIKRVKQIAGSNLNNTVFLHGRLPNDEAINLMQSVDIVGLPTYYKSEAFPISILEAMALTKMVISTNRAAIPDILTAIDGSNCGIIVQEKSVEAIVNAIRWCQSRTKEADEMRYKAYEKVKTKYSTTVVYELYRSLYRDLLWNVYST